MKNKLTAIFSMLPFVFGFPLVFAATAQAYIDPSALTYIMQAVIAIVLTVAAGLGIYWRRAKKKIDKALNIDENKNKTVEADHVNIDVDLEDEE